MHVSTYVHVGFCSDVQMDAYIRTYTYMHAWKINTYLLSDTGTWTHRYIHMHIQFWTRLRQSCA
jgi:hypothetical protein